ncbi:putative F-box/LRR-repeat protein At3g28410 isoform X1 [Lactuca sativa]|uniref:F-box/LRR-repeat protein 15/At3g58940/PEG3-like LRR domain-containing protein n=1 Tax=Lactuca sativa TaxID=4236 RepID=A0A9R1UZM2_LACSA|nr:putative F-box/LRR-repeat protein At3g28410 isoform X1 [Lactuca sativa]XP_023748433.1 putative F-box/LRR-repeat protein At3g28410 isoform X1 [Lactuca sativa]KAJ0196955.1 hypothetical protein LSAT_V11C700368700 [Lactuca sativa]
MLDQTFFTSSCFTKLKLDGCMVNPVGAISWKNLRSLSISYWSLNDDLIENILSGSPVLETLVFDDCHGYRHLHITSKSVKNLVLSRYRDYYAKSEADIVEINAPNILSLTIKDDLVLHKLLLVNVSSLVKANLNYTRSKIAQTTPTEVEEEMLKGFIMNLGHVKELKIGILCSKVLSCLQAKGFIFPSNVIPKAIEIN